ncbi:MAG TPA: ImmA/IrrE family metallo-endopeptidase [Blastocatellia bacterium]|nr:ImmA/IrrE family metallo-endopeptidase [Blastocatellia bacterium]
MRSAAKRRRGSDRFLVERFADWIPGWGRRQLALSDFYELAESLGVEIVEYPFRRDAGQAFWVGATPYVYYSSWLSGPEQVITCYHELAHILYHPSRPEVFKRTGDLWNMSKCDRQAEIVGVIAWIPDTQRLSVEGLMEAYGVNREIAEFRAGLGLWPAALADHLIR